MSNCGRFIDRNPALRPAGKVTSMPGESTETCIKTGETGRQTPPHIKKYRKSFNADPGAKQIHYGVADDQMPPEYFTYGKKTHASDHVNEVIGPNNLTGLIEFSNKLKEDKYHSSKNEPLGRTMERNYAYPSAVHDPSFKFGYPVIPSESAKNLLFPEGGSLQESEQHAKMYYKSHGATDAGEQIQREYNWNVDPHIHRFGLPDLKEKDGAAIALQPERYGTQFPQTVIVKKTVEDFTNTSKDPLGKSRNLGQGRLPVSEDHAFGQTRRQMEWDARRCIHGEPSQRQLEPDQDLGRSNRFGYRNQVRPGDESRVFGVPSIRTDINQPKQKSVADPQNYGNELPGVQILFPDYWQRFGLEPDEFHKVRDREELRDLFDSIGSGLKRGKFEAIYNKASTLGGVSIATFVQAMKWYEEQGLN